MQTLNNNSLKVEWPNSWGNFEHSQNYESFYDKWKKDQKYEGKFFGNSFHSEGTYQWDILDSRTVYEGSFYSNLKQGYGTVSYPNNVYFEGLFINNQPFGPGILTYSNGRQDIGFWLGKRLVRLGRSVDYIVPRLAATSSAKIKLLQFRRLIPVNEITNDSATNILEKYLCTSETRTPYSSVIYDPRSIFFHKPMFDKMYFVTPISWGPNSERSDVDMLHLSEDFDFSTEDENTDEISAKKVPSHCLCKDGVFVMKYEVGGTDLDYCDEKSLNTEFPLGLLAYYTKYGTLEGFDEASPDLVESLRNIFPKENVDEEENELTRFLPPQIVSWNRSELCIEMLKQIFRFRAFEEKITFKIAKLMLGVRTAFRKTGEMERQCLQFLKMCSLGPPYILKELLCNYNISEELMDGRGNNGIMFAAAADQEDLIDILADYGVDVNNFNDESLTPLNLCLLRKLAQSNNVSNWEVAFLPKEVNLPEDEHGRAEEWRPRESIQSLDRIFGDGMSIDDTKPHTIEELEQDSLKEICDQKPYQSLFLIDDLSDFVSEITILNHKSDPGICSYEENESLDGISNAPGNIDPTPKITAKLVPKTVRRDEYVKSVKTENSDKYLFEFGIQNKPLVDFTKKIEDKKSSKGKITKSESLKIIEESEVIEEPIDPDLLVKLQEIDRTIEKLLERGADPNISEVPKPSIHLGVYTKDVNVVELLLQHGAYPNAKLYPNEGLLTPLHLLALLKSAPEHTEMCKSLLLFGANPEEQTTPEFFITEDEKEFLDSTQGRTPLHLLCMRPDMEWADPNEHLKEIGLILAKVSDPKRFYNGHSYLTLAMMSGNIKFLEALLESKIFDPNELLGNDLGTTLHVLVSTKLQIKTVYDSSIAMCDLLLAHGADPLKKFKKPEKLIGTCVDYGYREIEAEKQQRKPESNKKEPKSTKSDKNVRDYLKDQIRVVEYLGDKAKELKRSRGLPEDDDSLIDLDEATGFDEATGLDEETSLDGKKKKGILRGDETNKMSEKKNTDFDKDGKTTDTTGKSIKITDKAEKIDRTDKNDKTTYTADKNGKITDSADKDGKITNSADKDGKITDSADKDGKGGKNAKGSKKTSNDTVGMNGGKDSKKKKNVKAKSGETVQVGSKNLLSDEGKKKSKKSNINLKDKKRGGLEKQTSYTAENAKKCESNTRPDSGQISKLTGSEEKLKQHSQTFPEKIRQTLLEICCHCPNLDINELLLPYVVLRNGDLYYRFQGGKPLLKEQYSMV